LTRARDAALVEHLPSISKGMDLTPSTEKQKKNKDKTKTKIQFKVMKVHFVFF
jgi:hypothetical protein